MNENQTISINPALTAKQKETLKILMNHTNGVNEVLYGGAAGGGKSFLGCLWIIICCLKYPQSRWLIGRAKLATLRKTTLKTFFEVAASLGLKEGEHYKFNQVQNEIRFFNGSEIILKDLFSYPADPDFDSLGSLEIAGAFIDEANQISEKAKNIVMSRIRHKLDSFGISPKLLMSCNPSRGWLYSEFYKKTIDNTIELHKKFIQSLITDNPFITKHYITGLQRQDEITKQRLLFGNWNYSDDELCLFNYDRLIEMFIEDDAPETSGTTYISIDVARLGKDKTCIQVWKDLDVIEIIEVSKQRLDEQADIINKLMVKYGIKNNSQLAIDTDGVGGGLADNFRGCVEIINNSRPFNGENYQNLKSQLYFKLADLVNASQVKVYNVSESIKTRLIQELMIVKREKADQDTKLRITSKEQIKNLIGRSPDISDALAYRMYWVFRKAYRQTVFM